MSALILYTSEDGKSRIQLRAEGQTVWLTQAQMAELFDVTTDTISLHLKNIFSDNELEPERTTEESSVVQREGAREVRRPVTLYNLDAILAVGYRVRSKRGVQFRRWASTALKEYLLKGFVMDDERLKNPDGRPDHFDEMLSRIRDIRASEKRFYQKVRELFALSVDYDKTDRATQVFFATVQNQLLYAVTGQTAAELIMARANPDDPHFGLRAWSGGRVRKQDILIAKNYLSEDEIDTLNRLVTIFLETAELRTKNRQEIPMRFWRENVSQIISSNDFPLLANAGSVSHARMETEANARYFAFDEQRKQQEALAADAADTTELAAIENKIKRRLKP
ncbi:virulence RhuM family protein [Xanthomonas campestris pv. campestris]|uniref:virulence RhuM family protein n=1 Tax=Xanthomonas campestris TaxID=339 RepID=UPI00236877B6|nr:virulence RhuM family protein [Xanthomonas campestris]MDO0845352.1 virulence RhuM family protein [Xanthomonas campestris pv. campestris]MEB1413036.1 virulence RhuM family protein [Xanthomonas campestris pv. campestris]MEB1458883.1 virulence RhuM family protein [Xanthomonas campestris pv. campestris]MEB1499896.1 virulence RhuM family protein [Xanthomonas campestris pv. campestris]MEB1524658.1 virulence RhuM family protein [Xanthomonas campestris pv. campestris]